MSISVYKFGGASVKDAERFLKTSKTILSHKEGGLVVVVSAIGKTTNALEHVVRYLKEGDKEKIQEALDEIFDQHKNLCAELSIDDCSFVEDIKTAFAERQAEYANLSYDQCYDQVICIGELLSSNILFRLINQMSDQSCAFLDARNVIRTNNTFRDATVLWKESTTSIQAKALPALEASKIVISQGFIAGDGKWTTTLGREGSDYSAAIFAYCLDATSVTIWKDVKGILTADPTEFANVEKIDRISYKEAIEMTYYGAKVIHPKTIKPLQNKGIKLYVKPFGNPTAMGTLISNAPEVSYPPIVVVEKNQALLHIATRDFSFVAEHHMRFIFGLIADRRIKVNMMRNTAISFTICVTDVKARLEKLIEDLRQYFDVVSDHDLELITIRHAPEDYKHQVLEGRTIIFEEKIEDMVQMVVRKHAMLKRIK